MKFIGVSLVVHALLCLLVLWKTAPLNIKSKTRPTFVEWTSVSESQTQQSSQAETIIQSKLKNNPQNKRRFAKNLQEVLRTDFAKMAKEHQVAMSDSQFGKKDYADLELGTAESINKSLMEEQILPRVWQQIRSHTSYRREHSSAQLEGDVKIRVRINPLGQLIRIMEESASGPQDLVSWVILCLAKALEKPFLTKALDGPRTLELQFYFSVGQQARMAVKHLAKMIFPIEASSIPPASVFLPKGHLDSPSNSTTGLGLVLFTFSTSGANKAVIKDPQTTAFDWSYYEKERRYKIACDFQRNQEACDRLRELHRSIGKDK